MHPHDDLLRLPARAFVLGDGLDVDVFGCTATVWHPRADLGRLHVLLAADADDTATIAIDLDLLTGGMNARVDRGRVTVWPCWDDDVVCLGLRGTQHAVVELPRPALANFLADAGGTANLLRQEAKEGRQAPAA
jgi:hypothetical protein